MNRLSLTLLANLLLLLILSGCSSCSEPEPRPDDAIAPTADSSDGTAVPVVKESPVNCPHVAEGLKPFAIKSFKEKKDDHLVRVVVEMSGESIPNWNALGAQVEITTPTKARVMVPAKNICLVGASQGVLLVHPR